jgi:hypothetical protein
MVNTEGVRHGASTVPSENESIKGPATENEPGATPDGGTMVTGATGGDQGETKVGELVFSGFALVAFLAIVCWYPVSGVIAPPTTPVGVQAKARRTTIQIAQESSKSYFDIPPGDHNSDPPDKGELKGRSLVLFVIEFYIVQQISEEMHGAKLFLDTIREPEYSPYELHLINPERVLYPFLGRDELERQTHEFEVTNEPFHPVTLVADLSKEIKIPAYQLLERRFLNKEDASANILVALHIGTRWIFFLARVGQKNQKEALIHSEVIWRNDCTNNTAKEVLGSFERQLPSLGSHAGVRP